MAPEVLSATSCRLQGYPECSAPGAGPGTAEMLGTHLVLLHPPSLAGSLQRGEGLAGLCTHLLTHPTLVRIPGLESGFPDVT